MSRVDRILPPLSLLVRARFFHSSGALRFVTKEPADLSALAKTAEELGQLVRTIKAIPKESHSNVFYFLMGAGMLSLPAGYFLWLTMQTPTSVELKKNSTEDNAIFSVLNIVRKEKDRLEQKYKDSFTDSWLLSFPTRSQGYAHKLKIDALKKVEKELDQNLGGAGKVSEAAWAELITAYDYYPEETDLIFKQYLHNASDETHLAQYRR